MRYSLTFSFLVLLFACNKPVRQHNEINKIELARGGAWSDQGAVVSIDSTLSYRYYGLLDGGGLKLKRKYYKGKITQAFWDTLNNKFKQINFKTLDTIESGSIVEDAPIFQLIIYWGTQKRQIIRVDTGGTDAVSKTLRWLDRSFKKINLHQIDTPFKFETTYQDPPHPKLKQVKFPPPTKKEMNTN